MSGGPHRLAARRQRLTQLQLTYGDAIFASRVPGRWFSPTSSSAVAIRYDRITSILLKNPLLWRPT